SFNNISPLGTYIDQFTTQRWLLNAKIHGLYELGEQTTIKPELALSYFEETQESYTDSLSNTIPEQTVSFGQISFGPSLERRFEFDKGYGLRTSIGISGVFTFAQNEGYVSSSNAVTDNELRARVHAGLELQNEQGISINASVYSDGIGQTNYESYGGALRLTFPLQ
ncbi:unnamed protein product, partial [Ectocarpus sp. 8 AP-2014]